MHKQPLDINGNKMAFLRFGTGTELLIAIPGYGDRAVLFERLEESLSERYTVYALQLPRHGESNWINKSFTKSDFAEAFHQIKEKEGKEKISLMGFSFGGRVICAMLEEIHPFVKEIFLLAPDGFNKAYIKRTTFLPKSIRHLLQATLSNPSWYLAFAKALHKIGLLKSYSLHFIERHLATEKRRKRLFLYWNSMDDFQYDEQDVGLLLSNNKTPTTLILGKTDRVIPTAQWNNWGEHIDVVTLHFLEEGHKVVGEEMNVLLKKLLASS